MRQITRCRRGGRRWVNRFGSDRRLHRGNGRFELTKFESICLRKQQRQPWLLDSIIFHTIPRVCAVMECIQWVAWTSSVWTFVSLSWCLRAFGRSKSSDAMPRAKESTEFDSTFQGKHSFWDFLIFIYQEGQCTRKELWLHRILVDGSNIDVSIQTLLESPQFRHGRRGNDMNCMLVLVFYTSIQAFTLITTNVSKWERSGRLFLVSMLGLTTSINGLWVIFTLARCGRTNSFAAYVLAFTQKSSIKCINVPYKFLHWRFSSLLNSENCLDLTM